MTGHGDAEVTEFIPRVAHLEQDEERDPDVAPLMSQQQPPRFRWACDLCRGLHRFCTGTGRWTSEERANDEADAHDRKHWRERKWSREHAGRGKVPNIT